MPSRAPLPALAGPAEVAEAAKVAQLAKVAGSGSVPNAAAGVVERQILAGEAPAGLSVRTLNFARVTTPFSLPAGLKVGTLELSCCSGLRALPPDLEVRRLDLSGAWNPEHLLPGVRCYELDLRQTAIRSLPEDLRVEYRLDLEGCTALERLPTGLEVASLILRGCLSLEELPDNLEAYFLDLNGCTALQRWPERGRLQVGRLTARGCAQLRELPAWLERVSQLDLRDCANLTSLPEGLVVTGWIDVAGTGIQRLPKSLEDVQLRWRGVAVEQRVALDPASITAAEILAQTNAERRRVLLERMGYEAFLAAAEAKVIDEDRDFGGPRRLLEVPMKDDENLVCVTVMCPSTSRQYVVRVPPTTKTCHQAVAWICGFDDPSQYRPLVET